MKYFLIHTFFASAIFLVACGGSDINEERQSELKAKLKAITKAYDEKKAAIEQKAQNQLMPNDSAVTDTLDSIK